MMNQEQSSGCAQVEPLLEAYALGVLDAAEQQMVAAHLPYCQTRCQQRVREYQLLADALPDLLAAGDPQSPPPALKSNLMREIESRAERPLKKEARPEIVVRPTGGQMPQSLHGPWSRNGQAKPDQPSGRKAPIQRSPWPLRLIAYASFALILLALVVTLSDSGRDTIVGSPAEVETEAELTAVDKWPVVLQIDENQTGSRKYLSPPEGKYSYASGVLVMKPSLPIMVLTVRNLEPPPEDFAYFVWLGPKDKLRFGGILTVDESGSGSVEFENRLNTLDLRELYVTLQPFSSDEMFAPRGGITSGIK